MLMCCLYDQLVLFLEQLNFKINSAQLQYNPHESFTPTTKSQASARCRALVNICCKHCKSFLQLVIKFPFSFFSPLDFSNIIVVNQNYKTQRGGSFNSTSLNAEALTSQCTFRVVFSMKGETLLC